MSVQERMLAPVPASAYAQPGVVAAQRWSADFNVACWLRGRATTTLQMTLLLRYRDAGGEKELVVDRAECRQESSMLLAGRSSVRAVGRIEDMSVWLRSEPSSDVMVDELYVQRVGAAAAKPLVAAR